MSKFKVGDKVRCIEAYPGEAGVLDLGGIYTVSRVGLSQNGPLLSFKENKFGAYSHRFELAEEPLADWEQKLLGAGGMPKFKVGDRVAVAFENTISSIVGDNAYFDNGLATTAAPLSSLTKLTEPIPTANRAIISILKKFYVHNGTGWWHRPGVAEGEATSTVQGKADEHGFTVVYAGDK